MFNNWIEIQVQKVTYGLLPTKNRALQVFNRDELKSIGWC